LCLRGTASAYHGRSGPPPTETSCLHGSAWPNGRSTLAGPFQRRA
jgi:hypothetical protein